MKPIERRSCRIPAILLAIGLIGLYINAVTAVMQAQSSGSQYIQVGYAIVTPTSPESEGLVVMEATGQKTVDGNVQPGIPAQGMTTSALLMINTSAPMLGNLAIAIANPNGEMISTTLTLRRNDGSIVGEQSRLIGPYMQRARFLAESFPEVQLPPQELPATLQIQSSIPVSITGLQYSNSAFSQVPVTILAGPFEVPVREPGVGGPGSVIFPYFAMGADWDTPLFIANSGPIPVSVRVDLYKQNGTLMFPVWTNRARTFAGSKLSIPAGGGMALVPWDWN